MGPKRLSMTHLAKWHELKVSYEDLRYQATRMRFRCRLCQLLWHSISEQRRNAITWGRRWLWIHSVQKARGTIYAHLTGTSGTTSGDPATFWARFKPKAVSLFVKVWEERPITRYTFAQLLLGNTAVGARLLIPRGEISTQRRSLSTS